MLTEPQDIISKTNCSVFSDSCCERKKNMVIYTLCCATVCTEMSLDINHSFLVHGHTFLPSDHHCGFTETEAGKSDLAKHAGVNPLNTELNPTCHLLVLLGAHHILYFSRVKVKRPFTEEEMKTPVYKNMQNLSKSKGEEKLRWDKNTAEKGFKNEREYRQSSVYTS